MTTPPNDSHIRVLEAMAGFAETQLVWLNPVKESWQPSDLLPDMTGSDWPDTVRKLREASAGISDELLVVLVGDTVTEEALPSYQTMLNRHPGLMDTTGAADNPWARWTRGWTAEENRHGALLSRYLHLSGRVNMRAVDETTQYLIRNGFDAETDNDPYKGLIYTSFQERATRVSHGNVGQLAIRAGDPMLGKICNLIAGDEARHEEAYKGFVKKILELDPNGGLLAFADMMRRKVTMPARLMADGNDPDLFNRFSTVAQRVGVYTAHDYASIIEHLVAYWKVPSLTGLSGEGAEAQDYLSGLATHYHRFADRIGGRLARQSKAAFSWIFNREA